MENSNKIYRNILKAFIAFYLLVTVPTFFLVRGELVNLIRERLIANAASAALAYDGDMLETITPENHFAHTKEIKIIQKINTRLESIHPDICFAYVMFKNDDNQIAFLVDSITTDRNGDGKIADNEKGANIGEIYPNPTKEMKEAFIHPTADKSINQDRWGKFLSGYAPIYNSQNKVVAIVGLDILSSTLEQKMYPFYLICLLSLILGIVASVYFAKRLEKKLQ